MKLFNWFSKVFPVQEGPSGLVECEDVGGAGRERAASEEGGESPPARGEQGGVFATIRSLVGRRSRWPPHGDPPLDRSKSLVPSKASSISLAFFRPTPPVQVLAAISSSQAGLRSTSMGIPDEMEEENLQLLGLPKIREGREDLRE